MSPCPHDNPTAPKPLKTYTVLFAVDVPHYARTEIEAEDDAQAIAIARTFDNDALIYTDGAWDAVVSKRIVHIEDSEDNTIATDIALDEYVLFNRSKSVPLAESEYKYSIDVNNDDGDCYDIAILRGSKPIATLIATEPEVYPLIHAGNCFPELVQALERVLRCFSEEEVVNPSQLQSACRNAREILKNSTGGSNV